jgi:hypothetical protein
MFPEASTLTALMVVFGRCASIVEGPDAAPQTEISEHPTRSRRVASMIQLSARERVFGQIWLDMSRGSQSRLDTRMG